MSPDSGISAKILVLGGSGYVGQHLLRALGSAQAVGTFFRHPFPGGRFFDPERMPLAALIQPGERFSHALLLFKSGSIDAVAADRESAYRADVTHTIALMEQMFALGIQPVFASSDAVFDGAKGDYTEEDVPNPLLEYGRHKLLVEQFVQQSGKTHLIIRLSKVYGVARHDQTIFTQWLEAIPQGTPLRLAWDQTFSPIFIDDVVAGIRAAIRRNLSGLFHLSGPAAFSRVDLFYLLLATLQKKLGALCAPPIQMCRINDFNFIEPRPIRCSMNSEKLVRAAGLSLHRAESCCQILVDSLDTWPPC